MLQKRRTCARLCHAAGGELEQIQFLLGHVSIQTTERYLGFKQRIRGAVNAILPDFGTIFMRFRGLQSPRSTVWPVNFGITGSICARALKSLHLLELRPRGHHDWPVMPTDRPESPCV